jgi:hypothetical protein
MKAGPNPSSKCLEFSARVHYGEEIAMRWALWVAILMLFSATALARKWDNPGGTPVDGEYRGVEGDRVVVEKRGGKTVRVPLTRLSPRDQEYVWARQSLRSLTAAAALENVAALAEACNKTVAEVLKESAGTAAETAVKRELAQVDRRKDVEAALRKVCDGFAGKPLTIVFPITDVRRAKYVPNPPVAVPGGVIIGPRWRPAGPDDYELLLGPPKGQYAGVIKGPGILNVKLTQDQVLSIGRESIWVYSGLARLQPGEAKLSQGRFWVERGDPPVASIAASSKNGSAVSGGILIYLNNQRVELKQGVVAEKTTEGSQPAVPAKRKK